jgi:hypothetical protein
MNQFDELEKNIQHWYYTYQTIHKKILSSVYKLPKDEYNQYENAIAKLKEVKKKYGTIDITDIKDLHR